MQISQNQKEFILSHEEEDVRDLALRFSGEDMPLLLAQIAGRQKARQKVPSWYAQDDLIYPVQLSLEQASSEVTAAYKGSLTTGNRDLLVDLTGGMGVDFSLMAPGFREAMYVEQNKTLCEIAAHNFRALGLTHATVHNADAGAFLSTMEEADWIYLDPSRRDDGGRKVFRIEDCTPDLSLIRPLLLEKAAQVMIKYSPMLDISLAVKTLSQVQEVHVVSVDNECKELLFLLKREAGECRYHTVNIKKNGDREQFSFGTAEEEREAELTAQPGRYLYEPNASILKAGAFNVVANRYQIKKLHRNSHLYTSDMVVADFPGRVFRIEKVFAPHKEQIRQLLSETKKANITVRNFPMSVADIRKKTGLKEGGNSYLFATTLADDRRVWIVSQKLTAEG